MRKLVFTFLIFCSIPISFISCSKDSDSEDNGYETSANLSSSYKQVLKDIDASVKKLATLRVDAKEASGGRAMVIQEQISKESNKLNDLRRKKKELESKM